MKADELRRQGYERGRADAEAEVMSLRQRVSELEGADLASDLRACMDELADARVTEEQHVKRIAELEAKLARCVAALDRVLTEAGMQAHKHGCPERLRRPAKWDEHAPCAGCQAEAALAAAKGVE